MTKIIGQSIRRVEDPRFLRGEGRYVGDIRVPGMLEAAVLRSPHAHATVRDVRTAKAEALPGVVAVVTGKTLAREGLVEAARKAGARLPIIAAETVHYVGQPVAVVVAGSRYEAEDGA